jgi:hypothetical protein
MNLTDPEHIIALTNALTKGTDAYLVIFGERWDKLSGELVRTAAGILPQTRFDTYPPADWVELTQPCPTCDDGHLEGRHIASYDLCWNCEGTGRKQTTFTTWCEVETCNAERHRHPSNANTSCRIPLAVGTVHQLLPVRDCMRDVPDHPCIEIVTECYTREWYACPPDATHDAIMHRMIRLHRDRTVNDYIAHITRINKPC